MDEGLWAMDPGRQMRPQHPGSYRLLKGQWIWLLRVMKCHWQDAEQKSNVTFCGGGWSTFLKSALSSPLNYGIERCRLLMHKIEKQWDGGGMVWESEISRCKLVYGGGGGLVTKLCLILWEPMDCSSSGSSVFQAGIQERVVLPSSRGSFPPRDQTPISWIGRRILSSLRHLEIPNISL